MAILSDLFSKATTSLPLLKISKWDVMVKKGQAPKRKNDNGIVVIEQPTHHVLISMPYKK